MAKPSLAKPIYVCAVCQESYVWVPQPGRRGRPPITCGATCKEERLRELWRRSYAKRLASQRRRQTRRSAYSGEMQCAISDCGRPSYSRGWCATHYARWRRIGDPVGENPERRQRYTPVRDERSGYIYETVPGRRKRQLQHRLVMEQVLGRPLLPSENVHHLNGDRSDNRPENLELWSKSQPAGQRVADKVAWAIELLALYQPDALRDVLPLPLATQ